MGLKVLNYSLNSFKWSECRENSPKRGQKDFEVTNRRGFFDVSVKQRDDSSNIPPGGLKRVDPSVQQL